VHLLVSELYMSYALYKIIVY